MKLEYVASGAGFMRLVDYVSGPPEQMREEQIPLVNKWIRELEAQSDKHTVSFLFNAHTEKEYGRKMSVFDTRLYGDSGGLQIMTQGLDITPEMKTDVYLTQAKYADFGMSFDEIPVELTGDRASRGDTSSRIFDRNGFKSKALQSGLNLKEHLEVFAKEQTKCKPFFIAHGADLATYSEWTELAMSQIPDELKEFIGGVAMGSTALGYGIREDMFKAFYFSQLPIETKHLHVLGVGSPKRLLPYLMYAMNGVYSEDLLISYDSTSQSSAVHYGSYYSEGAVLRSWYKNPNDPVLEMMYSDFKKSFSDFPYNKDVFVDTWLRTTAEKFLERHEDIRGRILTTTAVGMINILNVVKEIERISDIDKIREIVNTKAYFGKDGPSAAAMLDVKSVTDFIKWHDEVESNDIFQTKRVASRAPDTLGSDLGETGEFYGAKLPKPVKREVETIESFF